MILTIIVALLHHICNTSVKTESSCHRLTTKLPLFNLFLVNLCIFWRHDLVCYHLRQYWFHRKLFIFCIFGLSNREDTASEKKISGTKLIKYNFCRFIILYMEIIFRSAIFQRSAGLQTVDVEHGVHGPRTKVFFMKVL